ncbi:MAG: 3-deoxy-D-manno-octulosonic acid transferase [Dysgonamonadaceae bacterium]|jgi:3-deoxy-D-manno-octulosonic-acid transferase|nr:3-deoxy-D-manno-octulosonic acid transferase [Dysgonamonadaceae bacterium]
MYSFVIGFYAMIVRIISPFHKKAGLMVKGQKQTFDILRKQIDPKARYIWFHAASLGEFEQGRPLIEKIRDQHPEYKILLTFFSPSGYEVLKNYSGVDVICYLPFDFYRNAKKFLKLANPEMAIFIKYEFWQNYLNQLHKKNIPTYIVSAIFRPTQIFFKWYGTGYRSVLKDFNWLFVQDQKSMDLLNKYKITNVSIAGDTRFDRVAEVFERQKSFDLIEKFLNIRDEKKDLVLIAGSSWSKDEDLFIPYFNSCPALKLIIAPHEINEEHLQYIASKLERPYAFYSKVTENEIKNTDCLIIDSFGILSSIYRYGEIVYIGGGFGAGIHNILEAAVYGKPVIFGPNYQKFKEANDLIACHGGFSVQDQTSFNEKMNELLSYNEVLDKAGKQAGKYVQNNVGATRIILEKIFNF